MYDNPNFYPSSNQSYGASSNTTEPLPYLDPVTTLGKYNSNDYEAAPELNNYEQPHLSDLFDNIQYEVADYPLPTSNSIGSNPMQNGTLPVGEELPEDEQIYEDPGHIKEEIYEWFKQRNIFKIDKNNIRYINILIFK